MHDESAEAGGSSQHEQESVNVAASEAGSAAQSTTSNTQEFVVSPQQPFRHSRDPRHMTCTHALRFRSRRQNGVSVGCQTDTTDEFPREPSLLGNRSSTPIEASSSSDGVLRLMIQNFPSMSDTVRGPAKMINGVQWRIMVMPRQHVVQKKGTQKCLGFFLQCCPDAYSDQWQCQASAELRLISQKPNVSHFTRKTNHIYTAKENDWGYSCFMTWADILDESQGYIKDERVVLEVSVKADAPKNILTFEEFQKSIQSWYDLAEMQYQRGCIDLAIEANAQAIKFCKDRDESIKKKLEEQKQFFVDKKLVESIQRIEQRGSSATVPEDENTSQTAVRLAITANTAQKTGATKAKNPKARSSKNKLKSRPLTPPGNPPAKTDSKDSSASSDEKDHPLDMLPEPLMQSGLNITRGVSEEAFMLSQSGDSPLELEFRRQRMIKVAINKLTNERLREPLPELGPDELIEFDLTMLFLPPRGFESRGGQMIDYQQHNIDMRMRLFWEELQQILHFDESELESELDSLSEDDDEEEDDVEGPVTKRSRRCDLDDVCDQCSMLTEYLATLRFEVECQTEPVCATVVLANDDEHQNQQIEHTTTVGETVPVPSIRMAQRQTKTPLSKGAKKSAVGKAAANAQVINQQFAAAVQQSHVRQPQPPPSDQGTVLQNQQLHHLTPEEQSQLLIQQQIVAMHHSAEAARLRAANQPVPQELADQLVQFQQMPIMQMAEALDHEGHPIPMNMTGMMPNMMDNWMMNMQLSSGNISYAVPHIDMAAKFLLDPSVQGNAAALAQAALSLHGDQQHQQQHAMAAVVAAQQHQQHQAQVMQQQQHQQQQLPAQGIELMPMYAVPYLHPAAMPQPQPQQHPPPLQMLFAPHDVFALGDVRLQKPSSAEPISVLDTTPGAPAPLTIPQPPQQVNADSPAVGNAQMGFMQVHHVMSAMTVMLTNGQRAESTLTRLCEDFDHKAADPTVCLAVRTLCKLSDLVTVEDEEEPEEAFGNETYTANDFLLGKHLRRLEFLLRKLQKFKYLVMSKDGDKLETIAANLETKIGNLNKEIANLNSTIKEKTRTIEDNAKATTRVNSELRTEKEKCERHANTVKEKTKEIKRLEKKIKELTTSSEEKDELKEQRDALQKDLSIEKKKVAESEAKLRKEISAKEELRRSLATDMSNKEAEVVRLQSSLEESRNNLKKAESQLTAEKHRLSTCQTSLAAASERARKAEICVVEAQLEAGLVRLELAKEDFTKGLKDVEDALSTRVARSQAEQNAFNSLRDELKTKLEEVNKYIQQARADANSQIEQLKKGKLLNDLAKLNVAKPPPMPKALQIPLVPNIEHKVTPGVIGSRTMGVATSIPPPMNISPKNRAPGSPVQKPIATVASQPQTSSPSRHPGAVGCRPGNNNNGTTDSNLPTGLMSGTVPGGSTWHWNAFNLNENFFGANRSGFNSLTGNNTQNGPPGSLNTNGYQQPEDWMQKAAPTNYFGLGGNSTMQSSWNIPTTGSSTMPQGTLKNGPIPAVPGSAAAAPPQSSGAGTPAPGVQPASSAFGQNSQQTVAQGKFNITLARLSAVFPTIPPARLSELVSEGTQICKINFHNDPILQIVNTLHGHIMRTKQEDGRRTGSTPLGAHQNSMMAPSLAIPSLPNLDMPGHQPSQMIGAGYNPSMQPPIANGDAARNIRSDKWGL